MIDRELKILLLEDIAEEAELIERAIRKERISFKCRRVESRGEFSAALQSFNPDVVLSDHALPEFNSIEALTLSRKHNPSLPFILVTGTVSEEFAVTCLKQGADDYVLKSNLSRLPNSILHALNQRDTEQKKRQAEDELRLQNQELSRSNSELVKINSELDNFVYSVSHNLRGPLSSILGVINIARLGDAAQYSQYFDLIEQRVGKLEETLRDILDYSRNNRMTLSLEEVNLRQSFFENFDKLRYLPGADTMKVDFEPAHEVVIKSDPYRISLIFTNLLANAIRYSDERKPERIISARATVADNAVIQIRDNGEGIRADVMPRIFEMFYRGSLKSDGAGLGLYIAREAVHKLGGAIHVTSKEGEGASFTITLPQQNH